MAPMLRRSFLCGSAAASGGGISAAALRPASADGPERSAALLIKPETQEAIDRGLAWLAGRQNDDGSLRRQRLQPQRGGRQPGGHGVPVGRHTPGRGQYGQHVDRCVELHPGKHADDSGFICEPASTSHGPMYGHGFATLFLAEVYGMSPRQRGPREAGQGRAS